MPSLAIVARGRWPAAFVLGGSLFLGCVALFAGGLAGARGPMLAPPLTPSDTGPFAPSDGAPPPAAELPKPRAKSAGVSAAGRQAVCVRLCDGFFFPAATTAGGDEACAAQCPDAPAALYSKRGDRIEDAVSLRGTLYSALPAANRHQTSFDNTCTCHRSFARSYSAELARDSTLRDGDVVMTASGFRVYEGGKSAAPSPASFVALTRATNVPKAVRSELASMERAGTSERQFGSYSLPEPPALGISIASDRPRKGVVTVDDAPLAAMAK